MKTFKLTKETQRMKIGEYLKEIQNYSSRSMRQIKVYLNGKEVKLTKKLPSGGVLRVIEKEKGTNIEPIYVPLDIVYEDDDLLIINKQPFLLTHPTFKKADFTLANGVVYYFKEKYGKEQVPRFYNRLDMNTSGLIIVTKTAFAQAYLQNHSQFEKKYLAIVDRNFDKEEIIVEKPIYRDGDNLERLIDERGQYSKTIFRKVKNYPKKNVSLIECELFTGRTHQIRVHLKSEGHFIVGDDLYGDGSKIEGVERQFLHAYKIKFTHPVSNEEISLEIPIYEDMKKFLED